MDKITKRLKDYIDAHPFDPGVGHQSRHGQPLC